MGTRKLIGSDGRTWVLEGEITPPPSGKYVYRALHDRELYAPPLPRVRVPEVILLEPTHRTYRSEAIQWLSYYLFEYFAPRLGTETAARLEGLHGNHKAFCNNTGDDVFRNYYRYYPKITRPEADLPAFDKTRACGGAQFTGVEAYSLTQAVRDTPRLFAHTKTLVKMTNYSHAIKTFANAFVTNNVLQIDTIDADEPMPPLQKVLDEHWYFMATIVYEEKVGYFPNGMIPEQDIWDPSAVLLIANRQTKGIPTYPLWKLEKLPPGTIVDPLEIKYPKT